MGSPGAMSLRTGGAPSCTANTPAHVVFCGALCGMRLPLDGFSCGSWSCLRIPILGASHGGDPGWPKSSHGSGGGILCSAYFTLHSHLHEPSCGGIPSMPMSFRDGGGSNSGLHLPSLGAFHSGSSGVPSPHHALLFAQGSNTLGCAVVAFIAPPASSMLAVPLVGAGVPFMSNDAPPGSCTLTHAHSLASMPTFSAM